MSSPLVSIIIPVYNGSNFLKEAIDSALEQTYPNIEVIIINDGSDDHGKSELIAKSYGDKVRYFYKNNGGVSSALNFAVGIMKGDYLTWLSHDDVYDKNNIENLISNISIKEGAISAVKTGVLEKNVFLKSKESGDIFLYTKPIDYWKQWIYACSILIPKKALEMIGGFNELNKTTQDVELIWNILRNYEIVFLDKTLVYRRVHEDQGYLTEISQNMYDSLKLMSLYIEERGIEFFVNGIRIGKMKRIYLFLFLAWKYQRDTRARENIITSYLLKYCVEMEGRFFNICFYLSLFPGLFTDVVWFYYKAKTKFYRIIKSFFNFFQINNNLLHF